MSTLLESVIACGASSGKGTGKKGCKPDFSEAIGFGLTERGFVFDNSVEFDDAYVQTLVESGKLIPFQGVKAIEEQKTENSYEDIGRGIKVLDNTGLYEYVITFVEGVSQHEILSSYDGNGQYDFIAWDRKGTIIGTTSADSLKGYSLGVHQTELMDGHIAKNTSRQKFMVQFTDTSEFANNFVKDADDVFDARNIKEVNEIVLELTAPADTDTSYTVKARYFRSRKPFTGLTASQFLFKVNGATNNPSAGDDSATEGTYVLTGATAVSATDKVTASLHNNTDNRSVVVVGGDLFKSNTSSATVV